MSVRHFNYTARKRLLHADTSVTLIQTSDTLSFDAQLNLTSYDLPANALVILEAYRHTSLRRYRFGRVASPRPEEPTDLTGLPDSDTLLFRVKIVDAAPDSGKLLAEADRIRPTDPEGGDRLSLVHVRETELSGELWRLTFDKDFPVLLLEKRFGPRELLLGSPHFRWLVLPQLYRELLREAFKSDVDDEDDESVQSWQAQIVRQAASNTSESPPDNDGENQREEWITSAVRAFCRRHAFAQRYRTVLFPGVDS